MTATAERTERLTVRQRLATLLGNAAARVGGRQAQATVVPIMGEAANGAGQASGAMRSAAVWACCRIISMSISTLPVSLYRITPTGKEEARDHPLFRLLTANPNPQMSIHQYWQATLMHLLLWGNAYTFIDRISDEVIALWPLAPQRVRVDFQGELPIYRYTTRSGQTRIVDPDSLIHFRVFTLDGMMGLSVLDFHRMTTEFEYLMSQYAQSIYMNGGQPGGVLEYPKSLTPQQKTDIAESWRRAHGGPQNVGRIAILEGGMKYTPLAIPPDQLMYIDEKKFTIEQIARLFGVAPHLIGALDKPTYASVEQQSIEFVRYTINPYVVSLEQSVETALLEAGALAGEGVVYRFSLRGFERSDMTTRYRGYATGRQWGWLSANEIRRDEDMNEIPGGNAFLSPLNMQSVGSGAQHEPQRVDGAAAENAGTAEAGTLGGVE